MNNKHGMRLLEIARTMVNAMQGEHTLPGLYNMLRLVRRDVTIGEFHDTIRALHDGGCIRLRPYTRAYADIAGHREALYLNGEVMYYVTRTNNA